MPRPSARPTTRAIALAQESMLSQQGRPSSALTHLLENTHRPLSKRQRRIADEVYTRIGVMQGTQLLHEFGDAVIVQMHVGTQLAYVRTVRQLNAVKNSVYLDEETARDVADWTGAQKEMFRRHLSSHLEAGARRVIDLTDRELYEPDERPQGFLARLLGG